MMGLFHQVGRRCFLQLHPSLLQRGIRQRCVVISSSPFQTIESSSVFSVQQQRKFATKKDTKKTKDATTTSATKKNNKRHKKSNLSQQKKLLKQQQQQAKKSSITGDTPPPPQMREEISLLKKPDERNKTNNVTSTSIKTTSPSQKMDDTTAQVQDAQPQPPAMKVKSLAQPPTKESSEHHLSDTMSKKNQSPSKPDTGTKKPSLPQKKNKNDNILDLKSPSQPKSSPASTTPPTNKPKPISLKTKESTIVSEKAPNDMDSTPSPPQQQPQQEQHLEWVKFQQRISVDGFETGQTTTALQVGKKTRSTNKALTENQRRILERQRLTGTGGGEYPPLRYSDEETERLLSLAYNALPKRTGPRGSRNLKRQERRWKLVREIRAKQKAHGIQAHQRRMVARREKIQQVQAVRTTANASVQRDREYQWAVYKRWAATMGLTQVPAIII